MTLVDVTLVDKGGRHTGWNCVGLRESIEHGRRLRSQSPNLHACTTVRLHMIRCVAQKLCRPPSPATGLAIPETGHPPQHLSLSDGAVKGRRCMRGGALHGRRWGESCQRGHAELGMEALPGCMARKGAREDRMFWAEPPPEALVIGAQLPQDGLGSASGGVAGI